MTGLLYLFSPQYEEGPDYEGKEQQCTADVQNYIGIGELVNREAACLSAANVDAISARLTAADSESDGRAAAAVDRYALAVLKLAIHIDLDAAGTVDRAGVDHVGCHGYGSTGGNTGSRERGTPDGDSGKGDRTLRR